MEIAPGGSDLHYRAPMSIPDPSPTPSTISPLDSFAGEIEPVRIGVLYRLGLTVVALSMVLLPLVYIGLIVVAAWGVVLHLRYDTWLFDLPSGRAGVAIVLGLCRTQPGGDPSHL
jgi:hypothetical protein